MLMLPLELARHSSSLGDPRRWTPFVLASLAGVALARAVRLSRTVCKTFANLSRTHISMSSLRHQQSQRDAPPPLVLSTPLH